MDALEVLVGRWQVSSSLSEDEGPQAETTFEWLEGRRFLIQRWQVDHPEAPDGIAVIGPAADAGTYVQHYFDSRGVARVYEMTLADGMWKLWRTVEPPDFSQRFRGTFDEAGDTISGAWEIARDGAIFEHDFDLTYTRVGR
jgi:hypothetical protein